MCALYLLHAEDDDVRAVYLLHAEDGGVRGGAR